MPDTNISGQGYLYGSDPKATNPFYGKEESGGGGAAPDKYVKSATIVQGENSNAVKLRTVTVESGTSRTTDSTEWNITGEKGERGEQGQPGTPGAKGEQGEPGKDGVTPDITATATVSQTTGTASVTVTKTGTKEAPKFNFAFSGIKGEKGEGGSGGTGSGEKGDKGDPGEPGKAATISVGTTTTGAPGSNAAVTNTGTENAAVLNFTIPRGEKGDTGATGATGEAGAPGAKGEPGTPGAKGDPGEPGKAATISVGTTTTGAPGSNAAVTNTGTENAAVLNFTIPKGEKGDKGDTGADGGPGAKGDPGDPVSKAGLMTDVSMTNENGVYTFKQTKYDETGTATAESEIGTVEVNGGGSSTPGIVEVKDTVVENNSNGYDFHTITETENDGTENEVGKFYIAQKQFLTATTRKWEGAAQTVPIVNQDGTLGKEFAFWHNEIKKFVDIPAYETGKQLYIEIKNTCFADTIATYLPSFSDFSKYQNSNLVLAVLIGDSRFNIEYIVRGTSAPNKLYVCARILNIIMGVAYTNPCSEVNLNVTLEWR